MGQSSQRLHLQGRHRVLAHRGALTDLHHQMHALGVLPVQLDGDYAPHRHTPVGHRGIPAQPVHRLGDVSLVQQLGRTRPAGTEPEYPGHQRSAEKDHEQTDQCIAET